MICMTVAASLTLVAKQVRQSREAQAGTTPVVLTLPTVAFNPTHPLKPAGMRPALACTLASMKWQLVQWQHIDKRLHTLLCLHTLLLPLCFSHLLESFRDNVRLTLCGQTASQRVSTNCLTHTLGQERLTHSRELMKMQLSLVEPANMNT